jgi:lysophospholipase L1-like esterase
VHRLALAALAGLVVLGGSAGVWALTGATAASGSTSSQVSTVAPRVGETADLPGTGPSKEPKTPTTPPTAKAASLGRTPVAARPEIADPAPVVTTAPKQRQRRRAVTLVPVPQRPRVLPLGDSITSGIGSTTRSGYRTELGERLTAAGVEYDFVGTQHSGKAGGTGEGRTAVDVDHEGHPGWRIDQIEDRVDAWMAAARPDVVLLDIGTNDHVQSYRTDSAPGRLADLIDRILEASPTVRVVVAKLLVCTGPERSRSIMAFNAAIGQIVADAGPRVTVANMSTISNRHTVDGLHPDDTGYRLMSDRWFRALRKVLQLRP